MPVRARTACFGEIGLTGRLREATQADRRLEECAKLGLVAVVAPEGTPARGTLRVVQAETLRQAIKASLDEGSLDGERSEGVEA
jgi:DNA repair protein RadA/Sms